MSAVENLKKAVTDVQAENTLVVAKLSAVSTKLTDLTNQVVALQEALAASGTSDADVQAAADALEAGVANVQAAVDATPST